MYKQRKFRALTTVVLTLILTIALCTSIVNAQAPPANKPPIITNGDVLSATIYVGETYTVNLNAKDADKDTLTWIISSNPLNGTASLSGTSGNRGIGNAAVTYIPNVGFLGTDSIIVSVTDSKLASDSVTINVTVINPVNNPPVNTSTPSISGTGYIGEPLEATAGTWTDETPASLKYTYQWIKSTNSDGSNAVNISGATNSTYVPNEGDVENYFSVRVSASDGVQSTDKVSSTWIKVTAKPINKAPENTAIPSISSPIYFGESLTANPGTWVDETSTLTYLYQWQAATDAVGTGATNTTEATTNNTYVHPDETHGNYIRVKVTAKDIEGLIADAYSEWTEVKAKQTNNPPENTVMPTISGTGYLADTLTANPGTWQDETSQLIYSYQWQITNLTESDYGNIAGAIANTYIPASTNAGKYIRVMITASDGEKSTIAFSSGIKVTVKTITYVALGDSIATGTVYPGKVITSYVTYFHNFLKTQNPNTEVILNNHAVNGYRTNEWYDILGLNPNISANTTVTNAVQGAQIITISIGGNNLMQAAKDDSKLGGYDFNKIDTTVAERGVTDFNTQWAPIINKIRALNPSAQVIATNMYNPYNESNTTLHNLVDSYLFRGNGLGINDMINNNTNLGYDVADVFSSFDAYRNNMGAITYFYPTDWWGKLTRNPHPNATGQGIIFELHKNVYKPIE